MLTVTPVGTWNLDSIHSRVDFEVSYLAGRFKGEFHELGACPCQTAIDWAPSQSPGTNVAQADARFARDYREGTHFCPTFEDAAGRHRMLNAIETAAATGRRQTVG